MFSEFRILQEKTREENICCIYVHIYVAFVGLSSALAELLENTLSSVQFYKGARALSLPADVNSC